MASGGRAGMAPELVAGVAGRAAALREGGPAERVARRALGQRRPLTARGGGRPGRGRGGRRAGVAGGRRRASGLSRRGAAPGGGRGLTAAVVAPLQVGGQETGGLVAPPRHRCCGRRLGRAWCRARARAHARARRRGLGRARGAAGPRRRRSAGGRRGRCGPTPGARPGRPLPAGRRCAAPVGGRRAGVHRHRALGRGGLGCPGRRGSGATGVGQRSGWFLQAPVRRVRRQRAGLRQVRIAGRPQH